MAKKMPTAKEAMDAAGWAVGIAGLAMLLYGLMLFLSPARTLEDTVFFLGFVLIVAGALKFSEGFVYSKRHESSGFFKALGLLAILIGAIMAFSPAAVTSGVMLTFGFLAILLALLALASGIGQMMFAMKRKKNAVPLAIGALYVLLGIFMLINPLAATLALVSLIGLFAIVYGALLIWLAFYLRSLF